MSAHIFAENSQKLVLSLEINGNKWNKWQNNNAGVCASVRVSSSEHNFGHSTIPTTRASVREAPKMLLIQSFSNWKCQQFQKARNWQVN